MPFGGMLVKNTAAQSANLLSAYLFSILLAPVMLSQLGLNLFGVWALTGALATYAGLADLGITRSLSRFIALYDIQGDDRAIAECVGLGLLAVTGMTLVAVPLAVAAAPVLANGLDVISEDNLRLVLLCSVAILSLTAYRRVLNSVEIGLQQMVPPNVANVFTNVVNFAFGLAALLIHPDLVTYGAANALSYLIGVGAAIVSVRHVWGSVPLAWPSAARAREIVGFGVKAQVHGLADLINLQTDKIVIAFVSGIRAAAAYELGARVVVAIRSVGLLTVSALIPTVTARIAERGREAVRPMYRRYTRLTVGLSFPVFALACITAPLLLKAWLGEVPRHASGVVVLLSLAYLVSLSCEVGMNIATGDGRPGLVASNSIIAAVANVALTLLLAPWIGFWGVLVGTVLALSIGSAVFILRFHRAYRLPLSDYFVAVVPPAALSLGLGLGIALGEVLGGLEMRSRSASALMLLGISVAFVGIYWPIASRLGFLPDKLALGRLRSSRVATRHT
jgi:O-antigen/teichoic acid export membrane protein